MAQAALDALISPLFGKVRHIEKRRNKSSTQTINSSEVGNQLGKLIDDALQGQTTGIQRYGRSVAVIIPVGINAEYLAVKAALAGETQGDGPAIAE